MVGVPGVVGNQGASAAPAAAQRVALDLQTGAAEQHVAAVGALVGFHQREQRRGTTDDVVLAQIAAAAGLPEGSLSQGNPIHERKLKN